MPRTGSPTSSFILCTKNGGRRLLACLDHIERLRAPGDMELLLVDNGSTDGESFEALNAFAARSRFASRVLRTFVPGNSAGRNVALEHATGDVQMFIDDDCYVDPGFAEAWGAVFAQHDVGYASGMIVRFDPGHSMLGCNEHDREVRIEPGAFVRRGFIQGSNMAFRRECLRAVGRFDERFGAGTAFAGEEWDLALRASRLGWAGGYFPQPRVAHDHGRADGDARERLLFYDYGAGAVYAKNTFSRAGVTVFRQYVRELEGLRADAPRRAMLRRGYVDFVARRAA